MMSDPIHSSNDGLVQEPSLELPDDGKPMEEIAVENTDNVSRSKLQIAAILVALNVGLSVLLPFPFFSLQLTRCEACLVCSSSRPNNCINSSANNHIGIAFGGWLYMGRISLSSGQCRFGTNLGYVMQFP